MAKRRIPVVGAVPWLRGDSRGRPGLVVQIAVVSIFLFAYDALRNLAPGRTGQALHNAHSVLSFEGGLHAAPEHAVNAWVAGIHWLSLASSTYYDSAHYLITLPLLVLVYVRFPTSYRPVRDVLIVTNAIGLLGFWQYPLAPPRMLPGYVDTVAETGALGGWGHTVATNANEFAAMPSLHAGWALWVTVVVFAITRSRWLRTLGVAHAVVTVFVIVATGNHYLLDAVAGAVCLLAAVLVERAWGALRRRVGDRSSPRRVAVDLRKPLVEPAPLAVDRPAPVGARSFARAGTDAP